MMYCSLPDSTRKNSGMVFGDGRRHIEWNGPTHMLFKSAELYNDPYAQSFAQWMVEKGIGYASVASMFNMIWYNPKVEAKPFTDLPTSRLFLESSTVYTRSSWEPDAMLVGFKCTSNTTDELRKLFPGRPIAGGHAHPDAASFQVYAFGRWLAVDGGYSLWKVTEEHNTVMVNGIGQLGGDSPWFDAKATVYAAPCRITNADFSPSMDYIRADASGIYKPKAGLARFIRHIVYLKPHDLIVVDELEGKDDSTFTWYVHAEDAITRDGDRFFFSKGDVNARVTWLAPADYTADIFRQHLTFEPPVDLQDQTALAISNAQKAKSTMFVSMLNFYKGAEPETEAKFIGAENGVVTLELNRGGKTQTLAIDLNAGKAALK